jgi:hypothetical protein
MPKGSGSPVGHVLFSMLLYLCLDPIEHMLAFLNIRTRGHAFFDVMYPGGCPRAPSSQK